MSTSSEASFKVLENMSGSFVDVRDEEPSLNNPDTEFHGTTVQVLQHFYENSLFTDIVFHVQCGEGYLRFPCHKLVLSLWSPVFAKIFKTEHGEIVDVSEVPPSAFEVIIKYCYGIETELRKYCNDISFLLKVYKGAKEYKIKGLQTLCCEIFSCALPNKDNVFELLDAATFIGSENLKHRCYKVLQTQTRQIMESRELSDFDQSLNSMILDMTSLSLDSEYELINWMFEWGHLESAKQNHLTLRDVMVPFLPRLGFLSLKPEEFGTLVSKHKDFFDEKEGFAIFMNITCPGSWPLPPWLHNVSHRSFILHQ